MNTDGNMAALNRYLEEQDRLEMIDLEVEKTIAEWMDWPLHRIEAVVSHLTWNQIQELISEAAGDYVDNHQDDCDGPDYEPDEPYEDK